MFKLFSIILNAVFGSFFTPAVEPPAEAPTQQIEQQEQDQNIELHTVTRISDGDTIWVDDSLKIRYIGIDTPEIKPQDRPADCFAREALQRNEELVMGKEIGLEQDVSDTDKYDRLLRYIWIDDLLINEELVREGYAKSSAYPPDTKYQERFNAAEKEAKEKKLGVWNDECVNWNKPTPTPKPTVLPTVKPIAVPTTSPKIYVPAPTKTPVVNSSPFSCSCSKTCGQMASCEEAYYQLNSCGCSARDGDDDGVPCESICR